MITDDAHDGESALSMYIRCYPDKKRRVIDTMLGRAEFIPLLMPTPEHLLSLNEKAPGCAEEFIQNQMLKDPNIFLRVCGQMRLLSLWSHHFSAYEQQIAQFVLDHFEILDALIKTIEDLQLLVDRLDLVDPLMNQIWDSENPTIARRILNTQQAFHDAIEAFPEQTVQIYSIGIQ